MARDYDFMNTQTGGVGETVQAQPNTEVRPEDFKAKIKPPKTDGEPEKKQSPVVQETIVDAPSQPPINVSEPTPEKRDVGYVNWMTGEVFAPEIKSLENTPIQEEVADDSVPNFFGNMEIEQPKEASVDAPDFFGNMEIDESFNLQTQQNITEVKPPISSEEQAQLKTKYKGVEFVPTEGGVVPVVAKKEAPKRLKVETPYATPVKELEGKILTYPTKPDNEYRINDGVWQTRKKGGDYWHTITNDGSVGALNREYNTNAFGGIVYLDESGSNEYLDEGGKWKEIVNGRWTPVKNASKVNELNKLHGRSNTFGTKKVVSKADELSQLVGKYSGLFPNTFGIEGFTNTREQGNEAVAEASKTLKNIGFGFNQQLVEAANAPIEGGNGLFTGDVFGKKLITRDDTNFYETEITKLKEQKQKDPFNAKIYDEQISRMQDILDDKKSFVEKNNALYWDNVSKGSRVEKPIVQGDLSGKIHRDNLPAINNEFKAIYSDKLRDEAEVDRIEKDITNFANVDLDSWRKSFGGHLTDEQFTHLQENQRKMKNAVETVGVNALNADFFKNNISNIEAEFETSMDIHRNIAEAQRKGMTVDEYNLNKKKEFASRISKDNPFLERVVDLANKGFELADFVNNAVKNGKILIKDGVPTLAENLNQFEINYYTQKLNQLNVDYSKLKNSMYNTIENDINEKSIKINNFKIIKESLLKELSNLPKDSEKYQAITEKIKQAQINIDKLDSEISELNKGKDAFFLTNPKGSVMELSLGEDKDFFASIYKAIPSDLSPKAQFDLYYERLITEADKLQKNYGIDNSVLDAIGANWRANINGLGLDVDFLKLSDEEKRYFKIQQQLNSLAPLYLNNENGITEESAGFWKSFNNGLRSWLYGDVAKARGHVSGTDVARQQEDVVFNQMGLTEKDLTTPLSLEDLKERQNVNWVSGEFAGQTIGTTAGILLEMSTPTPFKASALKLLRGTHALDGLKLTKLEKPLETIFAKAERNLLNTRFGKFTYEALNKGVQMEIAGTKHASASEELNFASGVAGAIGGALFSKLVPVSVTKNLISGIFGQNADKAISVLTAVGERIKSGVGEVGEETLQTLNQIYNQTLDSRGFWDEIENQFGTFDKVMQFVVSSFVMGGAMHTSVPQSTMDLYNQLDSEDKAKVDEAISAVREDFKRTESKMNEDIEQAVVEEQEKEELLNTDLNATESKESVEEQPAVEQLEATESTEVETPIEQTASESDIDLEQQVDETPISDEETVVDDSVESVDLDNALSEVESELDELSFDDISEQALEESTPTLEPEVKTESKEETPAQEEEVKVVLPPVAKGSTPRFMKFIDGEWKMLIDGEYDSVADFIQKEAQIKYESEKRYKKEDAEKREHKRLADKLIEKLDQAKIDTKGKTFSTIPLAPQVWNGLIEVAKGLIKAGDSIAVAMQKAVASISASQNLTQEQIDKLNQHVQDMIDSDKIFVSLIPDNVWEAIKRQTANNVNKGIAPALAIKKATNDILKGLVDKGVLTAKEARNIVKGVNTKARYATKEAKKNNTYNDSDSFNKQVLGIKSAAIQALEEMGNSTDKVYIDTKGKEARQIIYNYAKSALSFDALNSSEVDKILKSLVNAKTYNDIKKGFDAVDDIVTRQQMAEKQSLIQSIKDSLKHKNLTTKKGTRRVGKLSLSAQDDLIDYIDSIDINNLGNMDMEELQEIFENISDIISFGKMDQKAMDKVRDLRERKTRGTLFEALKKRNKDKEVEFKQTGDIEKDVDEFFSGSKKRALVIDGNIATTATTAKKLFKENPHLIDAEIKGYTTSSSDVQRRDWGFQTVRNVADNLNLFNATRNINSHLLLLGKGLGKEAQAIVDKLRVGMNDAKHNEREGKMNKLATMGDLKKSIFGSNAKADKALFAEVDKSINEDFANNTRMPLTAGHVLAYYAIGQQSQPQEIIDENGNVKVLDHYRDRLTNSGVDMDKVDAFMNAPENSDLKRYADEMIKLLNTDWRNDYEPTFIDLTNRPFSDDVYFPSAAPNPESSFMNVEDVINKGSMNAMNATTGSLKERVGGQQVNTSQSFDEILIDYVDGMEHAKEYIPLAKQFNLIMSKENTPEIMKALGEKGFRQLVQAMGIEFTGDDGSSKNKWAEKAVSTWTYIQFLQTFALSLKQGVTQAVSAINLIGDGIKDGINPHTVLWNVIPKTEDEARFWMDMMTSNFIKERYLGTGLNPEMNRIISGGHKTHQKIHDFVVEVAASPMKLGDGASIVFGAIPLALSYYKQGLANGLSKEEAQDIAYRKFADSARRGLQTADSDVTTLEQKSPLAKVLLTFKSNQLQLANKAVDGYRTLTSRENLSEKEKSQAVWDILWYSSASAAFAAATSKAVVYMLSGLGDEVPEEEKEKVLKDIVVETVSSNIQGLGVKAVPVEWFVNSFFKGDDWKNNIALTRTLTSFVDGAKTGIKVVSGHGDKVTDSEKEKFFKTIGIGKGVDIYKNIGEYVEGDKHLIDVIYNFKDFDNKKNKKTEFEQLMSGYESEPKPFKSVGKSRGSQRGSQRGSSRGSQRGNGR